MTRSYSEPAIRIWPVSWPGGPGAIDETRAASWAEESHFPWILAEIVIERSLEHSHCLSVTISVTCHAGAGSAHRDIVIIIVTSPGVSWPSPLSLSRDYPGLRTFLPCSQWLGTSAINTSFYIIGFHFSIRTNLWLWSDFFPYFGYLESSLVSDFCKFKSTSL